MSNLERHPSELVCEAGVATEAAVATEARVQILEPRDVPLGGPRAMSVRRTLPQRGLSLIGPWCFLDHYGPDDVAATGGMVVPPHPHTGLQTVSWLFIGEIEHRDSSGAHALVRPGELNLMTAGRGISHSEVSTPETTMLHGVQLWVALPDATRQVQPGFEHYVPPAVHHGPATVRVFLGSLVGERSPATAFSPLVGAQLDLPAGASVDLPLDPAFEHGILVDVGEPQVDDEPIPASRLAYLDAGRASVSITAGAAPVRALLIGGAPLGEKIVMWWNFVGRGHDEIVQYREQWQQDVIGGAATDGRFGTVAGYQGRALPAPVMPGVRLKPRG